MSERGREGEKEKEGGRKRGGGGRLRGKKGGRGEGDHPILVGSADEQTTDLGPDGDEQFPSFIDGNPSPSQKSRYVHVSFATY